MDIIGIGGDVISMTNDDKISFTLRIKEPIAAEIAEASKKIGVSKNAYILMVLDEKLRKKLN